MTNVQLFADIPARWSWSTLGEITEVIRGSSPRPKGDPRYFGGNIPWIMISDLSREPGMYLTRTREGVTKAGAEKSRFLRSGSLILSNSGTVCVPKILKMDGCVHDGFVSFPSLPKSVSKEFLYYWFDFIRPQVIRENKQGVTQVNLNTDIVRALPVPVLSFQEQLRIVAKIEELFSDLDAGVAALERVRANLKRYRAAVLNAAVTGKLTEEWRKQSPPAESADQLLARILDERRKRWEEEQQRKYDAAAKVPPKGWRDRYVEPPSQNGKRSSLPPTWTLATLDQLTEGDRTSAYGVLQPGDHVPDGIPLVRVCDIADGRVDVEGLKRINPAISAQYERTILHGGELLLTIVGTIGRTAVVPNTIKGANTARAVAVIPITDLIPALFVELMLRDSSMRARLTEAAHEVARKTLNLEDVRIAAIPLAPLDEQREIIDEVERRFSVVNVVEAEVEHGLKRAARLRQAILKRAFEGKLVSQDPSDEPAQVLLERIMNQKGAQVPRKKMV